MQQTIDELTEELTRHSVASKIQDNGSKHSAQPSVTPTEAVSVSENKMAPTGTEGSLVIPAICEGKEDTETSSDATNEQRVESAIKERDEAQAECSRLKVRTFVFGLCEYY